MSSMWRSRWAAVGAAVAVTLGAGGLGIVQATTSSGERPIYKPINPCRLADTRPAPDTVGDRTSPLGPEETYSLTGWGNVGDCVGLPTGTTGLALNVTAVGPSTATYLTLFPSGATLPTASNLNPTPGEPPTPNAVNVDLSDAGTFSVFNKFGNVHIVVDVVGYYDDHHHDDRYYTEDEARALFGGQWAIFNTNGSLRMSTPGMADVKVVHLPPGYYCIDLPNELVNRAGGVVANIEDHVTGLQARTISVNSSITDGVCTGAGATWDVYVQTAVVAGSGQAYADSGFRLVLPPAP